MTPMLIIAVTLFSNKTIDAVDKPRKHLLTRLLLSQINEGGGEVGKGNFANTSSTSDLTDTHICLIYVATVTNCKM